MSLSDELAADVRLGLLSATAATELSRLQRCNQDAAAQVAARRGLTSRQTARLVDKLLCATEEPERQQVLETADKAASDASPSPKGTKRRMPAEQLVADAFAMKRQAARMHARLLERPLASFGAAATAVVAKELHELHAALVALCATLECRIAGKEVSP